MLERGSLACPVLLVCSAFLSRVVFASATALARVALVEATKWCCVTPSLACEAVLSERREDIVEVRSFDGAVCVATLVDVFCSD